MREAPCPPHGYEGPEDTAVSLTGPFWQNMLRKGGGKKQSVWAQVQGASSAPHSGKGPHQAACSGRRPEPGRAHGTLAGPSSPPSPRLLTDLSAPGTEGQFPQGRVLAARAWAPCSDPPPLRAAPSLGSVGGTCTWPGQGGKVTHTKFNNQQTRCGRPPAPTRLSHSPRAVSSACTQHASWPEERGAGSRRVGLCSLCGRLLDLGAEARGDKPRPLAPRAGAATVGCSSPGRGPAPGHHSPPSPRAG